MTVVLKSCHHAGSFGCMIKKQHGFLRLGHFVTLATPETECLLYATYWFRPILSELVGAAKESAEVNRKRAPSGPVKVVVTNQPHSRRHTGVDVVSGASALLVWFPAGWASKIAPCFLGAVLSKPSIATSMVALRLTCARFALPRVRC